MGEAPSGDRREPRALRWTTTAWCLAAGAFLSVAPHAWWPPGADAGSGLHAVMAWPVVKWSVSAFGVLLLGAGAWDVSKYVVEEMW